MKEVNKQVEREIIEPKLNLNPFKKQTNARTFKGFLVGRIKIARDERNFEVADLLQVLYRKYLEYERIEEVSLKGWKGKSSLEIIEGINKYDVITYQRASKGEKPKKSTREVLKIEVSDVLNQIKYLSEFYLKGIPTRRIAQEHYKTTWNEVFSNRYKHTQLNFILRLLDKKEIITYKGGITKLR